MALPRLIAHPVSDTAAIPAAPTSTAPVFYPIEDDTPLAESEHQLIPLVYAYNALTAWFAADPATWVGSDMFLYYEEGRPHRVVAPDLFIVSGTQKTERRDIFQTWVEGRVPDFILELTSPSTYANDRDTKFALYQRLGVREYWLYDPTPEQFLHPFLQGNRLVNGQYQTIPVTPAPQPAQLRAYSAFLGLELYAAPDWFRLLNPTTGDYLPNLIETQQALAANRRELAARNQDLVAERQALAAERAARQEMERLLRAHGIAPPPRPPLSTPG